MLPRLAKATRAHALSRACSLRNSATGQRRSAFTKPERSPRFAKVTEDDIKHFKQLLGDVGVVTDPNELGKYNEDWMRKYRGQSIVALRPKTTEQVSEILKHCSARKLAVVPQGGNTGLVGGSVPVWDEVVISLQRMNAIRSFDKVGGSLVCESGAVLQQIEEFLEEHNHTVPLDLAAKGSCQIGGNASTNAGGLRLLRYGSLHGSILGLEVVLPDGRVMTELQTLRKDNTGYDLKQLFIGAEGTLGIITAVSLLCPIKPSSVNVAFLGVESFDKVQDLYLEAKKQLGEILSAFEFLDRGSMELVLKHHPSSKDPLSTVNPFYILIETSGSNEEHDMDKLNKFLESVMNNGLVSDGTIGQDKSQVKALWYIRENISESLQRAGKVYKYDVSLPVSQMYSLVEKMRDRLSHDPRIGVVGYGHLGDANLHLNIHAPEYTDKTTNLVEPFVYEYTSQHKGSISAEHGLGAMKANCIHYSKSPVAVEMMRTIKNAFDPYGIMNPYKVLPQEFKNL